eukprot:TCONS_00040501-protein
MWKKPKALNAEARELSERLSRKRRREKEDVRVSVQLLHWKPAGTAQKYKRVGALEYIKVPQNASLADLKTACINHKTFKCQAEGKVCGILEGERGPPADEESLIDLKKTLHIRFIPNDEANSPEEEEEANIVEEEEKQSTTNQQTLNTFQAPSIPPTPKTCEVPKSFSIAHYLQAGQCLSPKYEVKVLMLEEFDFNTNKWNTPFATKFAVDLESFAKGGFREAFKARHIK